MILGGVVQAGILAVRGISSFCVLSLALLVASCGGGGGSTPPAAPGLTVGGTVSGLSGAGLVLQNNGGNNLAVSGSSFSFGTSNGAAYAVTVLTQPTNPSQTCAVTNGTGTVGTSSVSNVSVTCTTNTYAIKGTLTGLAGTGLVLQNNGGDNLSVTADGAFQFAAPVASGAAYAVTVFAQPTGLSQTCTVTNDTGTVGGGDVTNVSISCVTNSFTVGGAVSGHNGTGLTLRLTTASGTTNLFMAGNGVYAFPALVDGSTYGVTVLSQPVQQVCTVANGSGTLAGANVANIAVTCTTNKYTIGGTVSGLAGTGLVLQNNGGDNKTISLNGAFTFSTSIDYNSTYSVTVLAQPNTPPQTCTVSNGSGTVAGNVTNVAIACVTNSSTIGGTVFGFGGGTGLVLQDNGGDNFTVAANGTFTFSTPVAIGSPYSVTVFSQPSGPTQNCVVTNGSGTVPITNVTNVTVTCTTTKFTIGGTVSGLSGTGLVLQDNGGDNKTISADGTFTFATSVASGAAYAVTVLTQPSTPTQTCSVVGGTGTVGAGNVTNVTITCSTNTYTIGGTVSGLSGTGLVLQNNLGDNKAITVNGAFQFTTAIASGATYSVTVLTQPTNLSQTCTVTSGSGTVTSANITNVSVACTTNTYTVGGNVSGLSGTGLVLQNNAGNNLTITANGTFQFTTPIASGAAYGVTVFTQPTNLSQTCVVTSGSGTVTSANITNVSIACTTNSYTVGGTISGLSGTGLVLRNNGGNDLIVPANATAFTFSTPILSGAAYAVTVSTQPSTPTQTCTITSGSGTVTNGNITSVSIACTTNTYTIGGTVSGLAGTGLKLRNNNNPADEITIAKTGPFGFTFSTPIASGATYAVTVSAQPTALSQTCTVTANGSGTVGGANVTNVAISCTTNSFTVGGTVTGSNGTGLTLRLNGANNLLVAADGSFTFSSVPLLDGSSYSVTVFTPPVQQNCAVTPNNGNGTLAGANVTNIVVTCQTNTYTVGGTISGLTGTGLVLKNNGGDNLTVAANATTFTFSTQIAYNSTYNVTVFTQPSGPTQTCLVTANGTGTVLGAVSNVAITCSTNTYTIGGTVTGLSGAGLVLQDNGGDNKTISVNGSFTFSTSVASGANYAVTVFTQPSSPTQTCTVTAGTGTVVSANITNVSVSCSTNTYTIGGTITGLSGTGLVLRNNGGNDLIVPASATSFTFSTPVSSGATYAVTVFTQPSTPTQTCTVTFGSGTVVSANVTNVLVACTTNTYTIGGSITGLSGTGLVLRNNGGDNLTVAANATSFTFATPIASGATYAVTVFTSPSSPTQTCTVTSGTGTVVSANVTSVSIACTTNSYTIGGTVTGLAGTGLVLRNNGGDNKTISADGAFTFATPVLSGTTYNVTVFTQPTVPSQTCTVTNGGGTVGGAPITNVTVTCVTPSPRFAYVTNLNDASVSIYTVNATTGQLRFNGYIGAGTKPISIALDPLGKFAYVANNGDSINPSTVSAYAINASTGALTEVSGSPFGAGFNPYSVSVDPTGKFVYVANDGSNSVSAYTINSGTGVLTQINCGGGAGCVGAGFAAGQNPRSVSIDPSGKFLYVANKTTSDVSAYAINAGTGALTQVTGSPFATGGTGARSLTVDPSGKFLYVANDSSGNVSAFTINSGTGALTAVGGSPFASGSGVSSQPLWVTVDPTGRFAYVVNQADLQVQAFSINTTTGALTSGGALATGLAPVVAAVDSAGKFVYVSNAGSNNISAYSIDSGTGALTATSTFIGRPAVEGMAFTKGAPLVYTPKFAYVANFGSNDVSAYTINSGTGVLTAVSGSPFTAGTNPTSVAVDPTGRFAYVANAGGNVSAYTINAGTGALTAVSGSPFTAGTSPQSVAVDGTGRFAYVANGGGTVSAYTIDSSTGALTAVAGSPFAAGTSPKSVSVDPAGLFVYVANSGSNNVSAFTINASTGALTAALLSPFTAGTGPQSINVDPSGRFAYVANDGGDVWGYRIDSRTDPINFGGSPGSLTPLSGSPFTAGTNPASVTVDASGRFVYVANSGSGNAISRYTMDSTGNLTANTGATAGSAPASVAVDPSGKFAYVANSGAASVSGFSINGTGALTSIGAAAGAGTTPSSVTTTGTVQ
jgi:6-phosphogluconolactonase (cycloisomerase 2 family)/environmental stress-induced protein Ves